MTFIELEPCDPEEMRLPLPDTPPGLVLEMTDVGRGQGLPTDLSQVGSFAMLLANCMNMCSIKSTTEKIKI